MGDSAKLRTRSVNEICGKLFLPVKLQSNVSNHPIQKLSVDYYLSNIKYCWGEIDLWTHISKVPEFGSLTIVYFM